MVFTSKWWDHFENMIEIKILWLLFEGSLDWAKKCHHKAQIDFAILLVAQKVIVEIKSPAY